MSAIKQYIDLYTQNKDAICSRSSQLLNKLRDKALASLDGRQLPRKGEEGFEKTSIDQMFAPDYGVNINRMNIPVNVAASFRCDVPNMSTWMSFIVNDEFHASSTARNNMPQGVIVDSLANVAANQPHIIEPYFGKIAPLDNASVALNTMLVQDGIVVYVPRGVKLEKPLQLVNILSSPIDLMAVRRMLIIVEDNAQAQLLVCDHTQDNEHRYLASQVVEIFLGENARFDLYDIEESSALTSRYSQLYARQQAGSNLLVNGMSLIAGNTRNDYDIEVVGDNCDTTLAGMAIGSGKQHVDNSSNIKHRSSHCRSNQLFKYVLDDESTGAFEGSILVAPGATYTEAYQNNRNLLASTSSRMHTKPQLIIYNDEVKCSHGATTGQLDQQALFYMRARGISEKEARLMLMQAFMADVIDTVRMEGLRDRLRHLVEKRFYGQQMLCADCSVSCHDNKQE